MAHEEIRTLISMGDSIGVTLPKPWLDSNKAKAGDKVKIKTFDKTGTFRLIVNSGDKDAL